MNETDIDLRRIASVLRRQLRLIVTTLIVVVGLATIGAFALTPIFSASALILVDPSSKNLLEPESDFGSASADSARIDSEVEIMRSDSILLKVIASEGLISDAEFGPSLGWRARLMSFLRLSDAQLPTGQDALNDTLANLRSAVQVQRRGGTYLISVQVRSTNPEKSARLASAIANAYISEQVNAKVGSVLASRDILQARIIQARDAIVRSEDQFDQFIEGNIERITSESGDSSLMSMQRQIAELNEARENNTTLAQTAQASLDQGNLQLLVATLQSDALTELQRQRDELSTTLAEAGQDSPAAVDLRAQLARIDESLLSQAATEVNTIRAAVTQAETQEENLRETMRNEVLNNQLSAGVLTELYGLQQSAEIARTQYQTLLSRVQDLDAQANLQVADSRLVSPALAPQTPAFPNRTLIVLLSALSGLGLGIALAFLYENFIGGFTTEEQVESVLGVRFASAIPHRTAKVANKSLADLLVDEPLSIFAESIRRVRIAVDRPTITEAAAATLLPEAASADAGGRVIMVSSSDPNDGKSTVALALARSCAISGFRTLLIDCDLRKPSVHRQLGLTPSDGLQEFLRSTGSDNASLAPIIARDPLTDLTVIPGARRSDLPTDQLLASVSFARLVRAARATFDRVVIDTSPVGPVVDGLYIAPYADTIVFVARWATTSQTDAKRAIEALSSVKKPSVEILAVLNQQRESRSSYRQKYGGYYSEAY